MRKERDRNQVQVALDHAFHAELRGAVFARPVADYLLADAAESGLLGQDRDVAVHLAVDFDRLDHLAAVGFQSAVEVVEFDARDGARRPVEEFAGPAFADRVVTFEFPSRNHVVALFEDHAAHVGNFVGRVLQVGVHREDHVAFGGGESAVECGRLAVVAGEPDRPQGAIVFFEAFERLPRAVGRAVVDEDDFVREAVFACYAVDPGRQFGERLLLVVERHDHRDVQSLLHPVTPPYCCRIVAGAVRGRRAPVRTAGRAGLVRRPTRR